MAKNYWIVASTFLVFLAAGAALGMFQQPRPLGELGLFVEKLLLEHPGLLSADLGQELDELHRELRILETPRNPPRFDMRRSTRSRIRTATEKVLQDLKPDLEVTIAGALAQSDSDAPIGLPGDTGSILLRIDAGRQESRHLVRDFDFSRDSLPIRIETVADATYWILMHLTHVPPGTTTVLLELARDSGVARLPLHLERAAPGRLSVRIQSAETGEIAPAMVSLVSKRNGKERRPPGAIELADQFDSQGWATARRHTNLPGEMEGRFWYIVPEPFDMELSPGPWQITVRKGLEYVPVSRSLTIESRLTTELRLDLSRWVHMAGQGWYSGDNHVHAQIQSDADAADLIAWMEAEDLRLASVVQMGDIFRTYFQQRGFGPSFRFRKGDHLLAPAQECPRTPQLGHTLSLNTTSLVRFADNYFLYDRVFDQVHDQGGLTGYAHADTGAFSLHRDMSLNVAREKIDFFEILQFGRLGTKLYYDFLNLGFKVIASAGSDVPWGGTVGEVRVYAHIGGNFSADRWMEAFRAGRTFVTDGPILDFRVGNALPGDEIRIDRPDRALEVRARVRRDRRLGAPTSLQIISQGEVVKEIRSDDPSEDELELEFTIQGGDGFWIAARAEARDATYAHTTPVYVVRDGLRFWHHREVPQLIQQRRESLGQIEQMVSVAARLQESEPPRDYVDPTTARMFFPFSVSREGEVTDPYTISQLARQGSRLLERVTSARRVYRELEETWRREASRR